MIPRKKKICNGCETEQYIWAKGSCKTCYGKNKNIEKNKQQQFNSKAVPSIGRREIPKRIQRSNVKTYKRKPTGEAILFQAIWNTRPHICINCKIPLGNEAKTFYFSHIKSKGKYPELRLLAENIQLLCFDCHFAYDHQTKDKFNERTDLFKRN